MRCRVDITIEASLAIATGFNLFCVIVAVIYIITLKVDPEDFRWLQPKPKDQRDGGETKVYDALLRRVLWPVAVLRGGDQHRQHARMP